MLSMFRPINLGIFIFVVKIVVKDLKIESLQFFPMHQYVDICITHVVYTL